MGGKYEVSVWDADANMHRCMYMGPSLIAALWHMYRNRNAGTGCVSLHYRRPYQ